VQNGWVQAATTEQQYLQQQTLAREYESFGSPLQVLSATELAEKTGTKSYRGGLYCSAAGCIQPLSYTRELARVAMENGVSVFTQSAAKEFERKSEKWVVKTDSGQATCSTVLVCTNAYTDNAMPTLKKSVVPVRSVLTATEPLSAELRNSIMPNQITFVDKRRVILYFRYDRDGRLCVGDHGPTRDTFTLADFNNVKKRASRVFPALADVRWDYHWGGRVAAAMGMPDKELAFPVTEPSQFKLHAFHRLGVDAAVKWYMLRDYLEGL